MFKIKVTAICGSNRRSMRIKTAGRWYINYLPVVVLSEKETDGIAVMEKDWRFLIKQLTQGKVKNSIQMYSTEQLLDEA